MLFFMLKFETINVQFNRLKAWRASKRLKRFPIRIQFLIIPSSIKILGNLNHYLMIINTFLFNSKTKNFDLKFTFDYELQFAKILSIYVVLLKKEKLEIILILILCGMICNYYAWTQLILKFWLEKGDFENESFMLWNEYETEVLKDRDKTMPTRLKSMLNPLLVLSYLLGKTK
ncbi:hypothetical protein BpHYR1_012756 [Brachionus plicatilis]|uniref:Uncharacterized protein n=1 Tax=Brachionus plicatilis TaxID=10195 RepID=A0A3M7STY0_BRAPC|nr:hypothetical protein BpHYR1_012756 [Brachionus plicatilis]